MTIKDWFYVCLTAHSFDVGSHAPIALCEQLKQPCLISLLELETINRRFQYF